MRGVWRHLTELRMGPLYRVGFALRARGAAGAEPGAEDERAPWIEALLPLVRAVGVPEERARAEVFLWLATCRGLLWELTTGADPMVVGAAAEAFFAHCAGGGSR